MCLWKYMGNPLYSGKTKRGNLLQLSPVLYRKTKTGRHRRPRGKIPPQVWRTTLATQFLHFQKTECLVSAAFRFLFTHNLYKR